MVRRSWFEGPAGPGDVHSLETTTVRASYGHGDNDFCVVNWVSNDTVVRRRRDAQHPSLHECTELQVATMFRRKVASSHQK